MEASTTRASSLRIFVVENHPDTLRVLTYYLEEAGHIVSSATTMLEALSAIPGANYQVLVSDIRLPDGDGWKLLERLGPFRPPFAIAVSGPGAWDERNKSEAIGFQRHLLKPLSPPELDSALSEAASKLGSEGATK
jgi:CheY-like chemotaxis protein